MRTTQPEVEALLRRLLHSGRLEGVLGDPAVEIDVGTMVEGTLRQREARKQAYGRNT